MEWFKAMQGSGVVFRLGWTLFHTLWMGAGIAGLFAITLLILRRRSANARYLAGCAAIVVMVALPVGVFFVVSGSFTTSTVDGTLRPQITDIPDAIVVEEITEPAVLLDGEGEALAPSAGGVQDSPGVVTVGTTLMTRVSLALEPALPWAVLSWVAGVFAISLWRLCGWIAAERLKRLGTRPCGRDLTEIVVRLVQAMHIGRPVRALESMLVSIPTVLGWLRPVILLPVGIATGLTPEQLQAVIAHELAHIRRYDYLVNLFQSLAEIILFYHPVVWFISRRIRTERENCCDDIVVAAGAGPFSYAESLLHVAGRSVTLQGERQLAPARGLAATGKPSQLRTRIGRILRGKTAETTRLGRSWPAAVGLLATILIATSLIVSTSGQGSDNATTDPQPVLEDMQGESAEHGRVLHFPKDRSLGRLKVMDANIKRAVRTRTSHYYAMDGVVWNDGRYWKHEAEYLGEAQGDVVIPAGKKVGLFLYGHAFEDLSPLLNLKPDDLYILSNVPLVWNWTHELSDKCMRHIAHLTGLKTLWLAKPTARTEAMKHITKLQSLEVLVPPKGLTNRGLSYIAQLKSLKVLYLQENTVNNAGLKRYLPKLTKLEALGLWSGEINDAGLVSLVGLSKLFFLSLNSGNFTDAGMVYVKDIRSLRKLDLGKLPITDKGLRHLSGHPGLEDIALHGTQVTDGGLVYLKSMSSLKKLDIGVGRDQITDAGMVHLAEIKSLECLELPYGITDKGLGLIANLKNLKRLWVSGGMDKPLLTDAGLRHVSKLRALEHLVISGAGFTDAGMDYLAELKSLEHLSLYCKDVTIAGLSRLNALTGMRELMVRDINPDNTVLDISGLTKLEELWFMRVTAPVRIRDEDLVCLKKLENLRELVIGSRVESSGVTDAGIAYLRDLANMRRLDCGSPYLTDKSLSYVANMTTLTSLNIRGNFTDDGLRHLEGLKALRGLRIYSADNFSPAALDRLRKSLPMLRTFSAEPNRRIGIGRTRGRGSDNATTDPQPALEDMQRESAERGRVLHFPKDRSLGRIMVRGTRVKGHREGFYYWYSAEYLGEAQGDVNIPAGKRVALFLYGNALKDLSPLLNLKPDDLYMLSHIPLVWYTDYHLPDTCMQHIAHLTGLKSLWLGKPRATTEGMKHITKLQSLEVLVPPEGLTNKGLSYIAQLKSLRVLYFRENSVNNAGLKRYLPKLTKLEMLGLWSGEINDAGLVCLLDLPRLFYLSLNSGHFTDAGMVYVRNIPSLRKLDLGNLPITDKGLRHLSGHPGLEDIALHNTQITDRGLVYLKSMSSLKKLNIKTRAGQDQITDAGMVHLAQLKSLECLELPYGITDKGLARIANLKNLKRLWAGGGTHRLLLTDAALRQVSKLRALEYLLISGIGFTDAGMGYLGELSNLRTLNLSANSITNDGLAKLTTLKSLERLSLYCKDVTIAGVSHLNALTGMMDLRVTGIKQDNTGLDISGLTKLEELGLNSATGPIRDEDLVCVKELKHLKALVISSRVESSGVTDAGIAYLKDLPKMRQLYCDSPYLTDKSLSYLGNMKTLTSLNISGDFTDDGLRYLEGLKTLRALKIYPVNDFSPAGVDRLRKSLPVVSTFTADPLPRGGGRVRRVRR
jgi:beta-lactamase regulating signal transducer with metallopeptidase domain/Leucine-rich repeat (LRR) protein